MIRLFIVIACLLSSTPSFARVAVTNNPITEVTVADGYLHIALQNRHQLEGCAHTHTLVYPDTGKYFDAYLSMAMTALVTKREVVFYAGAPCLGGPQQWPQISIFKVK